MIKQFENRLDILDFLPWIKQVPITDDTHADIIGRYLSGYYQGLIGTKDGKPVALMIYYVNEKTSTLFIVLLYAKKQVIGFYKEFLSLCKEHKIKKVRGRSVHDIGILKNLLIDAKKLYSVYEKEI